MKKLTRCRFNWPIKAIQLFIFLIISVDYFALLRQILTWKFCSFLTAVFERFGSTSLQAEPTSISTGCAPIIPAEVQTVFNSVVPHTPQLRSFPVYRAVCISKTGEYKIVNLTVHSLHWVLSSPAVRSHLYPFALPLRHTRHKPFTLTTFRRYCEPNYFI